MMGRAYTLAIIAGFTGFVVGAKLLEYSRRNNLILGAVIGIFGLVLEQVMTFEVYVLGFIITSFGNAISSITVFRFLEEVIP